MKADDPIKILRNVDRRPKHMERVDSFANRGDYLLKKRVVDEVGKVVEVKLERLSA